jgi:hypothetical protein
MVKTAIFALIAAGLAATGTPAFAMCGSQVGAKHVPKEQQHGEYNKCMADPHNYK